MLRYVYRPHKGIEAINTIIINNEIFKALGAVEMLLAALSGAMIKNQLLVLFFISLAVFQYGRQ
ncbi:hypothetical protein DT075_35830 [Bacillus licheniformis]|nr:hypothetical protein DT075_35830 [Bacillus licheniformis]